MKRMTRYTTIERPVSRVRRLVAQLWPLWLLLLVTLVGWAQPARSAEAPQYDVKRCCNLCPRAANRASYVTSYQKNFTTLVQGKDGWLFRSDAELSEQFGPDQEGLKYLQAFARKLRATTGTRLVMVFQPTKGLVHPDKLPTVSPVQYSWSFARSQYADALENFRRIGLVTPNFLPLLGEGPREHAFYFKRDHHWTPYGARRAARIVADRIKQMPVYDRMDHDKQFVTRRSGLIRKVGSLQDAAKQLCGYSWPNQYVNEFRTEVKGGDDGAGESALFGNTALPPITLVGTSFSHGATDYNFAGWLQEYLGTDILNVAIAGGSYDGSMFEYLQSDNFRKSPPKILIWEVPAYHNLDSVEFYRQVIPLVTNGCADSKVLLEKTTAVGPGTTEVLYNGGGQFLEMPSGQYLIDLQFSDPGIKEADAFVWYVFGRKDRMDLEYGKRVKSSGRFVFDLREGRDWSDERFMSLDLKLKPEQVTDGLTVTARICRRQGL